MSFLPIAKPCFDEATFDEVENCLESGWLATGPRTQKFEQNLGAYCQAPYTMALTSGTAALHLTLLSLNLQPGDEVITTPLTFIATLNTIEIAGGRVVLVDVDPDSYNITPEAIEKAITPKTRAIVPVHFLGIPVDLDPIYEIAKKHNLRIIEDAAHAIGSYYKGRRIGSFGDTQIFSFHPNKVMTSGEGGAVTTHDEEMAKFVKVMRFHGIDRDAFNRFSKEGSQHYDVVRPGFKYNMMDLQAAIGLHQLESLEKFVDQRNELVKKYREAVQDWPEVMICKGPGYDYKSSQLHFTVLINEEHAKMTREEFINKMKEYDIGTGIHYEAAHLYSYYRNRYGYKRGDFPNAEFIGDRIVSLPLFPQMTDDELQTVIYAMKKIFNKA